MSYLGLFFIFLGLQCTNEGQRIRQKWQPYPEKLLTPPRAASGSRRHAVSSSEVVITPAAGVTVNGRGVGMKTEVEPVSL